MTTTSISLKYLSTIIKGYKFNGKPLVIGISGIQGSGKSYLTNKLYTELTQLYPTLNVVQFLMDDLYLTHSDQEELTKGDNKLLHGRGLPGTHEVEFGIDLLNQLINKTSPVQIPFYDKSMFNGEGDRSNESNWQTITSPADIILFEGWFNGFNPLSKEIVLEKYNSRDDLKGNELEDLQDVNRRLEQYKQIWNTFDHFIFFETNDVKNVYKWRLEQEHALLVISGGIGMTDKQVVLFVDRYMPVYYLYYDEMCNYGLQTAQSNLRIRIDENRGVTSSEVLTKDQ